MLDELRRRHPLLGFALYALTPLAARGQASHVTFEVYTPEGEVYSFNADTASKAMLLAFPDLTPTHPPPQPQEALEPAPDEDEDIFS